MHLLHRSDLGEYLNLAGLLGTSVEVGVGGGCFSREILKSWKGQRLVLVDCWKRQQAADYCDVANLDDAAQEENLRQVSALAQLDRRVEILQDSTPQAAARFADGSLDFVYIDANHSYLAARADLRAWYPKVKLGGLFAGHDYLDGFVASRPDLRSGTLFGVKTAVDEVGKEIGQAAAFTTRDPPHLSWYLRKRAPGWPGRVTVLTAYDSSFAAVGDLSRANKESYCRRHGYTFRLRAEGFDQTRPPAWSKVLFLLEELPACDWVFWPDADSLVMNSSIPLTWFLDDASDLIVSRDRFSGLNTGCFFVKNSRRARAFLEQVYQQEQFIHHPVWENAAVNFLYARDPEVRRFLTVVPNKLFNGYVLDGSYAPGDFMVHFPGLQEREVLMKNYAAMAR
jgi:hypothetical protein